MYVQSEIPTTSSDPCLIRLQVFEGPLDLLLHLIKKNEMDIYDIPVALIVEQYIEYLNLMRELRLEAVGEYLVMAAELGLIKSRMLLPEPELDQEEEDGDPRAELVRRLIEYQKFKNAALQLASRDMLGRDVFPGGYLNESFDIEPEYRIKRLDIWSLIDALREIHKRRSYIWEDEISVDVESATVAHKMNEIRNLACSYDEIYFNDLFYGETSSIGIIVTFLALLELIRTGFAEAFQDSPYSPIRIAFSGNE